MRSGPVHHLPPSFAVWNRQRWMQTALTRRPRQASRFFACRVAQLVSAWSAAVPAFNQTTHLRTQFIGIAGRDTLIFLIAVKAGQRLPGRGEILDR